MQCPSCQTINPPQAKFCLECGYRLVGCPVCGTINPPQARFCIECGNPLQPQRTTTSPSSLATPGADTRTTQPMAAVSPPERVQPAQVIDTASPAAILQTTAAVLSPSEERRIVTVMFADITGSTPLADRLDPEDMRAILSGYFNLMTEQIRKYDGTVEKYIGDAVMAVFGTPVTHEDDPDRAIRAALDMQQALTVFNQQRLTRDSEATRLQMRIGINTGEVATPVNTATQYQDFLITGDAVNIAARLQQNASPDTILVGERTYLAARDVFQFQDMAPLHLKGKSEPINAYVVRGLYQKTSIIMQHPRGILGRHTPLIGRNLELTLLHASYARVQAERRTHLITVLGAPGIGKSRLVHEFIKRERELAKSSSTLGKLSDPLVLKGRCPPYGEGITYWPLVEILRTLLKVQDNDTNEDLQQRLVTLLRNTFAQVQSTESAEEIADTLLHRTGRGLINNQDNPELPPGYTERMKPEPQGSGNTRTESGAKGALLRAWRVLLEALGELQPLIIVVDDLQWADEALLDLLEYLTDRIIGVPILFLCPARPEFLEHRRDWGGGHRNFTAIELDALTDEESNELVDALLNTHDFPEALRYSIRTRSEGNPFFVEEIVRMFIDQGILVREQDQERGQDYWRIEYPRFTLLEEPIQHIHIPELEEEEILASSRFVVPLPYVPDTIQGVLAARVDLLQPAEKLILQYGAIIGRTFWLSLLIEMTEQLSPETILEGLVSLIRRDFIVENTNKVHSPVPGDRSFNFKHILIRDVVYNNIPRSRRSREHARIALWIAEQTQQQATDFVELVAYHYQQALATWSPSSSLEYIELRAAHRSTTKPLYLTRDELRQRTITVLTLTGDQALHSYYGLRALQAYNDAYELMNDDHTTALERSRMLAKIGDASTQRGILDEAWKHYRRALQLVTKQPEGEQIEPGETDRAYLLSLYERLSLLATRWRARFDAPPDPQEIRRYINAGLQLLEGTSTSREYIAFLTYEAFWYIRLLEDAPSEEKESLVEHALQSGHRALNMAEELNNPRTLSLTLDAMGFIYFVYHRYIRARELQDRRLGLAHLINDKEELFDLYLSLGGVYEQVSAYPQALSFYGQANSYALTMESPAVVLTAMTGRMRVWRRWNRWDETEKVAHEILQFVEKYQQDERRQLWALEALATIAYHRGQQEQGDEYARQFKRLADQQMANTKQLVSNTRMHAINLAQENWTPALSDYQDKVRRSEPFPNPEILATLAELMVTTGQEENTETICERAVSLSESSGAHKSLAVALRSRGRYQGSQQHWEQAENDLRRALSICEELDLPWESAHTLYQLGLFHAQRARQEDSAQIRANCHRLAETYLERALGFYESLQAVPAITRTRTALEQQRASDQALLP